MSRSRWIVLLFVGAGLLWGANASASTFELRKPSWGVKGIPDQPLTLASRLQRHTLPPVTVPPLAGLPRDFTTPDVAKPIDYRVRHIAPLPPSFSLPPSFRLPPEIAAPSFAAFSLDSTPFSPEVVPEPATGLLVALGLIGLAARRRTR